MSLHFWIDLGERLAFLAGLLLVWSYLPDRLKTRLRRWRGVVGASVLGLVALTSVAVGVVAAFNHQAAVGILMLAGGAAVSGFAVQVYRSHPVQLSE